MSSYYLEHHGILGQKWGKRNGPPYPLDESDKSVSEKAKSSNLPKDLLPSDIDKMPKNNKIVKDILLGAGIVAGVAGIAIVGQKLDLWYWADAPVLKDIFDTKFTVDHEDLARFLGITW